MTVTDFAPSRIELLEQSMAVLLSPIMTTRWPASVLIFIPTDVKKSTLPITPLASSPGMPRGGTVHAPIPRKTASKPSSSRLFKSKSFPSFTPILVSIPSFKIPSISQSRISFGIRYSGIPYLSIPPSLGMASNITG